MDDLLMKFASIRMDDHDTLIRQFASVLECDAEIALFFLQSADWNVEKALNAFFSTVGGAHNIYAPPVPKSHMLTDISLISHGQPMPLRSHLLIDIQFSNVGDTAWPEDAHCAFVEGDPMEGPRRLMIGAVPAGGVAFVRFPILTPSLPGSHMACWRLTCTGGYFSEPIWIMLNTAAHVPPPDGDRILCQFGPKCTQVELPHFMRFCHPGHAQEVEFLNWRATHAGAAAMAASVGSVAMPLAEFSGLSVSGGSGSLRPGQASESSGDDEMDLDEML